jgi:hypothetical protein
MAKKGEAIEIVRSKAIPFADYRGRLINIKSRVQRADQSVSGRQSRVDPIVWDIARLIVQRQQAESWVVGMIDRLAVDLWKAFLSLQG